MDWDLDSRFEILIRQFCWIDSIRDSQSEIFNSLIEIIRDGEYRNWITRAQSGDSNLDRRIEFQSAMVNRGISLSDYFVFSIHCLYSYNVSIYFKMKEVFIIIMDTSSWYISVSNNFFRHLLDNSQTSYLIQVPSPFLNAIELVIFKFSRN